MLMHWVISSVSPFATASRLVNVFMSRTNARSELRSEVCCDRIVKTNSVMGSYRGSQGFGGYSTSNASNASIADKGVMEDAVLPSTMSGENPRFLCLRGSFFILVMMDC